MRLSLGLFLAFFFPNTSFALEVLARDPMGEMADYKVDRASARTTGMIQGGNMKAVVNAHLPDHADGPSYNVQIDYTLRIQFMGTRSGTQAVTVPEAYFTPEFMQDLRTNGEYISDSFKVQHMGYADARNLDGGVYPNCDKIKIYDIQTMNNSLIRMADEILNASEGIEPTAGFEDMVIIAHIKDGLPVLGAAKIDVSGVYNGSRVKAGADYERP
jgi:hypothetical protein